MTDQVNNLIKNKYAALCFVEFVCLFLSIFFCLTICFISAGISFYLFDIKDPVLAFFPANY